MSGMPMISNDLRSSCRALLLQSYDKGGGGGGIKSWQYPAEWLQLPDPGENEIYCLITIGSLRESYTPNEYDYDITVNYNGSTPLIDWGDGTSNNGAVTINGHMYEYGTGHRLASGAEQFIVKITVTGSGSVYQLWGNLGNYSGVVAAKMHTSAINPSYSFFSETPIN